VSATPHPFVAWLGQPENDVYRAFLAGFIKGLPTHGDRSELRAVVEATHRPLAPGEWHPLDLFDHAWAAYRPFCAAPDCKNLTHIGTDWCAEHELGALL
jgi:hypothetical protein